MNKSIKNLDEFINKYEKFIISTHESPDADGLGCEIAFFDLLKQLGKTAIILNSDPTPDICQFMDIDSEIKILEDISQLPEDIGEYAQFVLDTNDYDNTGTIYEHLRHRVKDCFIIDHHQGDIEKAQANFVKVEAASASEIVYSIILHYGKELNFKTAQALYAGIVFDTGSFRFPKTTSETFRIASHLVSYGVDPFRVYEHLYESNSISSFQLRGRIFSTMEVLFDGRMIAMKLTQQMVEETGGSFSEGESTINQPFQVKGVVASLLIKQDQNGPVKVSMRTKGNLNVAEIAISNGGGGHKNAAGYKSKLSFDETYEKAVRDMEKFFK
ncbi:MAG TPA: bifunctional oligoribonuclease/PAP phosphatase NrnA [Spirochaetota bacterium]|nr:bifunctional oligoribonuclease/PAP phosphatase NrnA [Spirochaetota bacterium]HPJ33937.1 bifunctional oligoribonuclease/PAP phosphatase NrnA [Spirochaetota bacterium]